jgi:hypothetical protein
MRGSIVHIVRFWVVAVNSSIRRKKLVYALGVFYFHLFIYLKARPLTG